MLSKTLVFLLAIATHTLGDNDTDGTNLISTFLVHRHGDRTPLELQIAYSTSPEALEAATAHYGYGQLTDVGRQRAYELGKFIRSRYNELLSNKYNESEIYIRSTDSTRAKMTVLGAMAAVFPAYPGSWSEEINWVPTPYTTVPAKYDFNLAALNCPVFTEACYTLMYDDDPRMAEFFDALNVVSVHIGYNITAMPGLAYMVYDVLISQINMGIGLNDEVAAIMADLEAAASVAATIMFANDDYLLYQAGPLLNEFFTHTAEMMKGTGTPPVRIYSAHDFNVYSLQAISQVPKQGVPKYASAFALELRLVKETGEYVVLPVYQPSPDEDLVYLPVAGCDSLLCPYGTFKKIVSPYLVDEVTWRSKCNFTTNLIIDGTIVL